MLAANGRGASGAPREHGHYSPILVTGMHRCGTTWAGAMLASGGEARYIHEPLNVDYPPRVMRGVIAHWYEYVCHENEGAVLPALLELLHSRYYGWVGRMGLKRPKDFLHACEDGLRCLRHIAQPRRTLLKCPFSVFSIPWFLERLGARVVVVVRNPLAVTSSLKRLGWPIDFRELLAQRLLMRELLEPFRDEMQRAIEAPNDVVGHGILLWRMIYRTVAEYAETYPEILVVRHEDLSLDPLVRYRELFAELNLPFTSRARRTIAAATSAENPAELPLDEPHQTRLDSRANLENWRSRLTTAEIDRVLAETDEVACRYYSEPLAQSASCLPWLESARAS
jgi:hypothetical protein